MGTRRTKQEVAADKKAKEAAKLEKAKVVAKKAKEAELQKGRKQAQRWDLGNMLGQEKATRAPRRSKVQIMLAKRAKEEAKKAKEQQNARQTALKNAVTMMKDAQAGAAKKKRAPKRSAVQVMLAKRAKEAEKRAKEEAKKAKEQQKARQTALKNAVTMMKDAQAGAKK